MNYGHVSYTSHDDHTEIHLLFPTDLFERLCVVHNVQLDVLTEASVQTLFVDVLGKWQHGAVSTEDLSSIANFLWTKIDKQTELASRLIDAAELSYYIRHAKDERTSATLSQFVARLASFYKPKQDVD